MRIGIQTWGSEGDVRPFLALGAGLRDAGHDVTLCVTDVDDRDYADCAERLGIRLRQTGLSACVQDGGIRARIESCLRARTPAGQVRQIMKAMFDPVSDVLGEEARALAGTSDLLVGHALVYPAKFEALRANIPYVGVMMAPGLIPSRYLPPVGMPDLGAALNPWAWKLCAWALDRMFLPSMNSYLVRHGFGPVAHVLGEVWGGNAMDLLAVSGALCQRPPDWSGSAHICGFWRLPDKASGDWLFPDALQAFCAAPDKPVFMTFGSMATSDPSRNAETLRFFEEASELAGCRAILQTPRPEREGTVGEGRIYVTGPLPHARVLPQCAAFVHHGGSGTTHCALHCGVPSVVVAHVADQFYWARLLHRKGVAVRPLDIRTATPRHLAKAIRSVLDDHAMRQTARDLVRHIPSDEGLEMAVRLILAKSSTQPLRSGR